MFALRSSLRTTASLPRATLFVRHLATSGAAPVYESILVSNPLPSVSLITLNRPKALNGESQSS